MTPQSGEEELKKKKPCADSGAGSAAAADGFLQHALFLPAFSHARVLPLQLSNYQDTLEGEKDQKNQGEQQKEVAPLNSGNSWCT